MVIDLRQAADFEQFNLQGSLNIPFIHPDTPSPFSDPKVLKALWAQLEDKFKSPEHELHALIKEKRILLLCYDGDSARVATSVLRAKGYEADSIRGGFRVLSQVRAESTTAVETMEIGEQDALWLKLSCDNGIAVKTVE